jgi:N utilization substance protein B
MIQNRDVDAMETVLRAILKTATYELLERKNVPSRTLLMAYVAVADAFFDTDGTQSKLISGILNAVARRVRPEEFTAAQEANG